MGQYCERTAAGLWGEPFNAVSNVAFLLACAAGARRLWLVTTNDNLDALRFYQRRGMRIVAVARDALDATRVIKPQVPLIGAYGIPLRDELTLELTL